MNKKTIITILLALVTMTGQAQTKNYTIRGNLSEVAKATAKQGVSFDSVTIMNIATNEVISKQTIQDGVFTIHVEVFNNFISICNTDRNEYTPKLKGTKKCNSEKWEI